MTIIARIKITKLLTVLILSSSTLLPGQNISPELQAKIEKPRFARIMFYNCENAFDYTNDSLSNDEEFLPEGTRYWNKSKYYNKLNNLAKVITAIGAWQAPEIAGLCEIENYRVLHDLTKNTALYSHNYKIIHKESPDSRGIDVALLYQPAAYKPIENKFITIHFPNQPDKSTRDILYTKGMLRHTDTLHLFVNHWPSRWGGELESENYRLHVASVLKYTCDSIFEADAGAAILIMGDFNDEPYNKSISTILSANKITDTIVGNKLYTLTPSLNSEGSHKRNGVWSLLDQFIISGNLLNQQNNININPKEMVIFNASFLLEPDENYLGDKPFRTYTGYKFKGGYSDHLPIFIDLNKSKN